MADWLPHLLASLNASMTAALLAGLAAIRRGNRVLHPRLMVGAVSLGVLFIVAYVVQTVTFGHTRFPGDDWVRTLFLSILTTHTLLAVGVVPLIIRTLFLAVRERLPEHRRTARITLGIWLYVATTGLVIYWMNNYLRPPA